MGNPTSEIDPARDNVATLLVELEARRDRETKRFRGGIELWSTYLYFLKLVLKILLREGLATCEITQILDNESARNQ